MAGELQAVGPGTGSVVYAVIHDKNGLLWYTNTFEAYNAAHWATYAVALVEQGTSGYFVGSMPALAAGLYSVDLRLRVGATPATTDPSIGAAAVPWNGAAEVSLASKLLVDESQIPTTLVAGSLMDLWLRAAARTANFVTSGNTTTWTLGGHTLTLTVDAPDVPTTGATTVA